MTELFSYGTLQDQKVQLATFGRKLKGVPDNLNGYRQTKIPVKDQPNDGDQYYFNAEPTGHSSDTVSGIRFEVTDQELAQADEYEASASYKRIMVTLHSGTTAWVYISADSQ